VLSQLVTGLWRREKHEKSCRESCREKHDHLTPLCTHLHAADAQSLLSRRYNKYFGGRKLLQRGADTGAYLQRSQGATAAAIDAAVSAGAAGGATARAAVTGNTLAFTLSQNDPSLFDNLERASP
jgi:hypothetical protein